MLALKVGGDVFVLQSRSQKIDAWMYTVSGIHLFFKQLKYSFFKKIFSGHVLPFVKWANFHKHITLHKWIKKKKKKQTNWINQPLLMKLNL